MKRFQRRRGFYPDRADRGSCNSCHSGGGRAAGAQRIHKKRAGNHRHQRVQHGGAYRAETKAAELLAFGKLEDLPSKTDSIMDACGLPGELLRQRRYGFGQRFLSAVSDQKRLGGAVRSGKEPKFVVLREGENGGGTLPRKQLWRP